MLSIVAPMEEKWQSINELLRQEVPVPEGSEEKQGDSESLIEIMLTQTNIAHRRLPKCLSFTFNLEFTCDL